MCFFDRNIRPTGQRDEVPERISPESLQKILTKFYGVARHVGRLKTEVTNQLRKML